MTPLFSWISNSEQLYHLATWSALVKNLEVLTAAEKTLADLEKPTEPTPNPDEEAAKAVDTLIDAIGTVTKDSEAAIKAARDAYNALTDAQKALVKNLDKLTAAHDSMSLVTPESGPIDSIPMHSGAERYYREKGLIK